jgi:hypothetical protein
VLLPLLLQQLCVEEQHPLPHAVSALLHELPLLPHAAKKAAPAVLSIRSSESRRDMAKFRENLSKKLSI